MKVYVILKGEYSDTYIVGVTKSKKIAEDFCAADAGNYGEAYFEEYNTDDLNVEIAGKKTYTAVGRYGKGIISVCESKEDLENAVFGKTDYRKGEDYLIYVLAKDIPEALKIAADRMAEYESSHIVLGTTGSCFGVDGEPVTKEVPKIPF